MGVFILELTHPLKHMALASSVHGSGLKVLCVCGVCGEECECGVCVCVCMGVCVGGGGISSTVCRS